MLDVRLIVNDRMPPVDSRSVVVVKTFVIAA